MAEYKAIRGHTIRTVAGDASPLVIGDIWYSSTTRKIRGVKLAAGWLIEQAGWKGYAEGDFGVHDRQSLVLVNRGNAKGSDIYGLSQRILDDVKSKFGVELEREVNVI